MITVSLFGVLSCVSLAAVLGCVEEGALSVRRARNLLVTAFLLWSSILALIYQPMAVFSLNYAWWSANLFPALAMVLAVLFRLLSGKRILNRSRFKNEWPNLSFFEVIAVVFLVLLLVGGALSIPEQVLSWDGWAIWGLKSKAIFTDGKIDSQYLSNYKNFGFSHLNYPLLYPLMHSWGSYMMGGTHDAIFFVIDFISLILFLSLARDVFSEQVPRLIFLSFGIFITERYYRFWQGYSGSAETLLSFFFSVSVVSLRNWFRKGQVEDLICAGLAAGLAFNTKMEGAAFLIAAVFVISVQSGYKTICRRKNVGVDAGLERMGSSLPSDFSPRDGELPIFVHRGLSRKWNISNFARPILIFSAPATLVSLPWLFIRRHFGLRSFYEACGVFDRSQLPGILSALLTALIDNLLNFQSWGFTLYLSIFGGGVIFWRCLRSRSFSAEASVILIFVLYFTIICSSYLITPFPYKWHIDSSLNRVIFAMTPGLLMVAILGVFSGRTER